MTRAFPAILAAALAAGCPAPAPGGAAPEEVRCDLLDDDGDGLVDEGFDADHDGSLVCASDPSRADCNDRNAAVRPGALERCDGLDNDCDGVVPPVEADLDGDGQLACAGDCDDGDGAENGADVDRDGWSTCSGDCDDLDPTTYPGAVEQCDGRDNSCAGEIGWTERDADFDGESPCLGDCDDADPYASSGDVDADGFTGCGSPRDCDDRDPQISPVADEICDDRDNDCDGVTDGAAAIDAVSWYADGDADGFGAGPLVTGCFPPADAAQGAGDCDDARVEAHPGAAESCNQLDDDCDLVTDEGLPISSWFPDLDADGYGRADAAPVVVCGQPAAHVLDATDCDDGDGSRHPGAGESCDGTDEDCDGVIDDNAIDATAHHPDADQDGEGDASVTIWACDDVPGLVADGSDCNDADPDVNTGADELCNGIDDDCDGTVDDGAVDLVTSWADGDGDGWGDPATGVDACSVAADRVTNAGDCDDTDPAVNPVGLEVCGNGVDDDCDGSDAQCAVCGDGICDPAGGESDASCCEDCDDTFRYYVANDDNCLLETQFDTPYAAVDCDICGGNCPAPPAVPIPWGSGGELVAVLGYGDCMQISLANSSQCWYLDSDPTNSFWTVCFGIDLGADQFFDRCDPDYVDEMHCP